MRGPSESKCPLCEAVPAKKRWDGHRSSQDRRTGAPWSRRTRWASTTLAPLLFAFSLGCLGGGTNGDLTTDIEVVNNRAPDCSSLSTIVKTVTAGCRTDDERAVAVYNFLRYVLHEDIYPVEDGGISVEKLINVYGFSLCGGVNSALAALYETAGYEIRYCSWTDPGHTTVEVKYGGLWHYLDVFLKFYAWMPNKAFSGGWTIAGQRDLADKPELASQGLEIDAHEGISSELGHGVDSRAGSPGSDATPILVCGHSPATVVSGVRGKGHCGYSRGWAAIRFDDPTYSTAVDLPVGGSLTLAWDREEGEFWAGRKMKRRSPRALCGERDYLYCPSIGPLLRPYRPAGDNSFTRTWSNGRLVYAPSFRNDAFLSGLRQRENVAWSLGELRPEEPSRPAILAIEMASPYVVVDAFGKVDCDDLYCEVSLNGGKLWKPVKLDGFQEAVLGQYRYLLRLTFRKPIRAIDITSVVQHNQEALPYLAPGRNRISITAGNAGRLEKKQLAVTFAYRREAPGPTPEQGGLAAGDDTPIVVQRIVEEVPSSFEILVPTPKGREPIYPRMLFLRREVLAPGEEPLPTPALPSTPTLGGNEYLGEVPSPWIFGSHRRASAEMQRPRPAS